MITSFLLPYFTVNISPLSIAVYIQLLLIFKNIDNSFTEVIVPSSFFIFSNNILSKSFLGGEAFKRYSFIWSSSSSANALTFCILFSLLIFAFSSFILRSSSRCSLFFFSALHLSISSPSKRKRNFFLIVKIF